MIKDDKNIINGYIQGNQREFFIVSNWIITIVENEYWGLKDYWADIIQDVRMKIYINLKQEKFRHSSNLKTYVCRITKYTCIDYLRKKYRIENVDIDSIDIKDQNDNFESLIKCEQEQILHKIFLKLKEKCRKILIMTFKERLSYKKISEIEGIAEGTVKSRVSRCIADVIQLKNKISGKWNE